MEPRTQLVDSRKIVTATILGVLIAVVKSPFTFPVSDFLNLVEVTILGLSFLILGRGGATYSGLVNGMIQSAVKQSFFPFNLIFAVCYGLLVDFFGTALLARGQDRTNTRRLIAALGLASTVLGLTITYVSLTLNLNPSVSFPGYPTAELLEVVYVPTVLWGALSGVVGGYLSARIWERNLRVRFGTGRLPS